MCDICLHTPCLSGCPNYEVLKHRPVCEICGCEIKNGENYIKNIDHEYIHFECILGIRQLLGWLGYEIKEME